MKSSRLRFIAVALSLAMFSACSSDTASPAAPAPDGSGVAPISFTVAFPSVLGVSHLTLVAAIDEMRALGFTIETPILAESELSVEGVATGKFEMSHGTSQATMLATLAGSPLIWVAKRVSNEWTMFARNNITSCAELNGVRLGIHSEGAVSTAMVKAYIDTNCPGTNPGYIVIPGSENRAAALLADQIDAAPVELADAIGLEALAKDRFGILANFAEDLPELTTATVYASQAFLDRAPDAVQLLVDLMLAQNQRVASESGYMASLIRKYIPDFDPDLLEQVAEAYSDGIMFPIDGGLTESSVQYTIDFFTNAGVVGPGLKPGDIWASQFLAG